MVATEQLMMICTPGTLAPYRVGKSSFLDMASQEPAFIAPKFDAAFIEYPVTTVTSSVPHTPTCLAHRARSQSKLPSKDVS